MEFLKEVLGDETFSAVQDKIDAWNADEANKDNQIKIGNLGSGQYVSKDKYSAKETELSSKVQELLEANNLIGDLKKGTKDNESLQNKIREYDTQIATLQAQLQETKIKSALKVALMGEKALDVDYLSFKLNEKLAENGKVLELDENDNIKGWNDMVDGLKIQFPTQFESSASKKVEEHKLGKPDDSGSVTRNEILKMPYQKRSEFASQNPEAYEKAMGRI